MTDLRKAAEMALELLEIYVEDPRCEVSICKTIATLRQALAQPEQEPVGYVTDSGKSVYFLKGVDLDDDTPLYTAPPKREWVGLTKEEKFKVLKEFFGNSKQMIDAVDAKLKEKNT